MDYAFYSLIVAVFLLPVSLIILYDLWGKKKYNWVRLVAIIGLLLSINGMSMIIYIECFVERHDYGMLVWQRLLPIAFLMFFLVTFIVFIKKSVTKLQNK